jgi:hypothetical protein
VTIARYYDHQYLEHFLPLTLAIETSLWNRAHAEQASGNLADIRRPSKLENWMSLLGSFAMKPERKYRWVGAVVRKE